MVDKNMDGMNPRASEGQRAGNPSQMVDEAKEQVKAMASQAAEQGKAMASQAAEQGMTAINQQKDTVVEQVDSVSGAIRSAADKLQQDGQPQTSHYVSMLADQIETFGRQLRNKDANELIRDVERLSRRAPVAFFAGTLVAGFVAARFLKSSAERSSHEYGDSYSGSRMGSGSQADGSYSWRNEMGEGDRDENIGRNRTQALDTGGAGSMNNDAASGTMGGQWGAGTTVAGPEITGIYRPSDAQGSNRPSGAKPTAPGTELPGSAQPAVSADGMAQPGRPTDAIGGSTQSASPTEPKKSGGNIHGNR